MLENGAYVGRFIILRVIFIQIEALMLLRRLGRRLDWSYGMFVLQFIYMVCANFLLLLTQTGPAGWACVPINAFWSQCLPQSARQFPPYP
jgi:hypothetical protein